MNHENSTALQQGMFNEMREKTIFKQAVDFGYQYLDGVFERPVYPTEEAILNLHHFEEELPARTGNAHTVIEMLNRYGAPATLPVVGARYFGFVNGSVIPASLAAKCITAFWDQNSTMYVLSPVAAKLESVVEKWLQQLLGLPGNAAAGYVSGTSAANLCALAAARYRVLKNLGWDVNEKGLFGAPPIRIVAGKEAHSSVIKAISLLGFGKEMVEWADVDAQGRIIPETMPEIDDRTILILQAGNVNSGSFDFFETIIEKTKNTKAWVHIDGAFGLWAAAVEPLQHLTRGLGKAHSWAVDGHKTLNTPYDCGIILCADKDALTAALHMSAGYLVINETERDGMFYTPEMSRRARIFELWAAIKYLGREGISQMVFTMYERALQFAREIKNMEGFTVLNEVVFNQVVVCCPSNDLTEKTLKRIQELRECWVGGSTWAGRKVIRVSICSWATTAGDIARSVQSFAKALNEQK
jgi:glutamate/tyrosine decarboxylase-like PLP-dependent enzyme